MLRHASGRWITGLLLPLIAVALPLHGGGSSRGDLVYVSTDDGVAIVDSATGSSTLDAKHAMPSGDWSRVIGTHRARHGTLVESIDPTGVEPVVRQKLDGNLRVRAVSHEGDLIALMPRDPEHYGNDGVYAPARRESTRIVVTTFDGRDPRPFDLDANVEPEAFSVDGTALFVIQYLPPMDPDRYRVRRLDLATGDLGDVFTHDKLIQGNMRGLAFDQAAAPDGTKLYTLYQKYTGETFVHLLDLQNQTAQCVLLPNSFGGHAADMAITARPDGAVFVVDPIVHEIAELDPVRHGIAQTRKYEAPKGDGPVVATATGDAIFVARGDEIAELGEPDLAPANRWSFDSDVEAIHVSADRILYIAVRDRLIAITLADESYGLDPLLDLEVDGISGIGESLPVTSKNTVQCAC